MSKNPHIRTPDHAQQPEQSKPAGQRPSDGPQNQTQDVQHQVGEPQPDPTDAPSEGHNPDPATNELAPLPSVPPTPIDPNRPELPRQPMSEEEAHRHLPRQDQRPSRESDLDRPRRPR
jgi:hypothetical protein